MGPKSKVKMDLGSFLNDETFGGDSWADDDFGFDSVNLPSAGAGGNLDVGFDSGAGGIGIPSYATRAPRPERIEYPVPDVAPFSAKLSNIPLNNVSEEDVEQFFVERLGITDPLRQIRKLDLPIDHRTGRIRGFGFIDFDTRELLVEALKLSEQLLGERKLYISVAAPESERLQRPGARRDEPDLDWGDARGSHQVQQRERFPPRGDGERFERRPRREEPDLDWGDARGSQQQAAPRERFPPRGDGERFERKPRREEPDLDWGDARGSQQQAAPRERFPPRGDGERFERKPRREEPDLDWGDARGSQQQPTPREKFVPRGDRPERKPKREEPDLDWGDARGSQQQATPAPRKFQPRFGGEARAERKPKSEEPDLDWGSARGSAAAPTQSQSRSNSNRQNTKKDEFDWNTAKSTVAKASKKEEKAEAAKTETPKKVSGYALLNVEEDGDDDKVDELSEKVANASL